MEFKYQIKKERYNWFYPYTTIVHVKGYEFTFELECSMTLWGAKKSIKKLKKKLKRKLEGDKIIKEGNII